MAEQYEHRVVQISKDGHAEATNPTRDPKDVGRQFRARREDLKWRGGGTVELQRRPVGEWETVEKVESGPGTKDQGQ